MRTAGYLAVDIQPVDKKYQGRHCECAFLDFCGEMRVVDGRDYDDYRD